MFNKILCPLQLILEPKIKQDSKENCVTIPQVNGSANKEGVSLTDLLAVSASVGPFKNPSMDYSIVMHCWRLNVVALHGFIVVFVEKLTVIHGDIFRAQTTAEHFSGSSDEFSVSCSFFNRHTTSLAVVVLLPRPLLLLRITQVLQN